MPTKRKDGRLQGSVVLENPVTGKRKRFYYYGKTKEELQRRRDELITKTGVKPPPLGVGI